MRAGGAARRLFPIGVSDHPLLIDCSRNVDVQSLGVEQCLHEHVCQFVLEVGAQLLLASALVPRLPVVGKVRLGELSDLLVELEDEPVICTSVGVPVGVVGRDRLDVFGECADVHDAAMPPVPPVPSDV